MSTTMTVDDVVAEAHRLDTAERRRRQLERTTLRFPDADLDDAYRIQAAWRRLRLGRGEQLVGHKIGLTSRAMQAAMNITTPDSGFLTDAMVFEPDTTIPAADHLDAKLEIELAFVLGSDLVAAVVERPEFGIADVLAATEVVTPALELIAARTFRRDPDTGVTRTVVDTVADNAANAGIIAGGRRVAPGAVDLPWVGAMLERNGIVEETGLAGGVLGHPAVGIVWLARRYLEHGMTLRAGEIILAGSFTRPIDVRAGDRVRADYGDLGSFEIGFT